MGKVVGIFKNPKPYSAQIIVAHDCRDESHATQVFTELTMVLARAGYTHVSTTILDPDGELVADFGMREVTDGENEGPQTPAS